MKDFGRLFDISGLSLDRLRNFLRVAGAGNLTQAAQGDTTKQSQYSRQIKELENFFGVALSRRVGRRIEITDEGKRLAMLIHQQFRELDDFREAMAGRGITVRFGSQGSVIDWLLIPRLGDIRKVMGNAMLELEQMRSMDVVRAVTDGRIDFGIVREDALSPETKRWRLGLVGYSVFAAKPLWKGCSTVKQLLGKAPVAELLSGGQYASRWREWIRKAELRPQVAASVSSFTDLARVVQSGHAAAVLPEMAAVDFDPKKFQWEKIEGLKSRMLVMIANARSLERSGIAHGVAESLASVLRPTKL